MTADEHKATVETAAREVDAAMDEIKTHLPTVDLADQLERCRRLALLALKHPCTRGRAAEIWDEDARP